MREKGWTVRRQYGSAFPDLLCKKKHEGTFCTFDCIDVECTKTGIMTPHKMEEAQKAWDEYLTPIYLAFPASLRKKYIKRFGAKSILFKRIMPPLEGDDDGLFAI